MADNSKHKKKAEGPESSGPLPDMSAPPGEKSAHHKKMDREVYEAELEKLQVELVKLQEWIKHAGLRVAVIFEGRDAAGKGGTIKRVTEHLNPRVVQHRRARHADRARAHRVVLPALRRAPAGRRRDGPLRPLLVQPRRRRARDGVLQRGRGAGSSSAPARSSSACSSAAASSCSSTGSASATRSRRSGSRRGSRTRSSVWKLSPMDLESRMRWIEYSQAKDEMFAYTDTKDSPWWVVNADDKRRARLNMIHHLLSQIPYEDVTPQEPQAGRPAAGEGLRAAAGRQPDLRARGVLRLAPAGAAGSTP